MEYYFYRTVAQSHRIAGACWKRGPNFKLLGSLYHCDASTIALDSGAAVLAISLDGTRNGSANAVEPILTSVAPVATSDGTQPIG